MSQKKKNGIEMIFFSSKKGVYINFKFVWHNRLVMERLWCFDD